MNIVLLRPVVGGWVSQWFGDHPAAYARFGLAGHNGIDYAVDEGTPVVAMHDGIVRHFPLDPDGYGCYLTVQGEHYGTLYAHFSEYVAADGARVKAGDVIGRSGNTGNSTGPHVHVGFWVNNGRSPAYRGFIDFAPFRDN